MHAEEVDGKWSIPDIALFSGDYNDIEPCFVPVRGTAIYFASDRPSGMNGSNQSDFNIWYTYKTLAGWSEPQEIGSPINTLQYEYFPSVTKKGTLYFVRNDVQNTRSNVYRARFENGSFQEPEKLSEVINATENAFNACIAPDESYLVFCSYRADSNKGKSDYYISFRDDDDNWSEAINLGDQFNTSEGEFSPRITPSGNYIFFNSMGNLLDERTNDTVPVWLNRELNDIDLVWKPQAENSDIYWVQTSVLKKLNEKF